MSVTCCAATVSPSAPNPPCAARPPSAAAHRWPARRRTPKRASPAESPLTGANRASPAAPRPAAYGSGGLAREGSRLVECVGAVPYRSGRLVGGDDDAGTRRGGAGEPQGGRRRAVAEQLLARAQVHGKDEQAVFV